MKTGIVFEIENKKAVLFLTGGSFVSLDAVTGWNRGDVVSYKKNHFPLKTFYAAAACFICIFLSGIGGHKLYFTETAIISMDINPSLEMGLNRFDRVINISGYNDDGADILGSVNLLHKNYRTAIDALMRSYALVPYLDVEDAGLMFTLLSNSSEKKEALLDFLNNEADILSVRYSSLRIDCRFVSGKLVNEAHLHGLTAGKYLMLLELKEAAPDMEIDDYRGMSIREIKKVLEQNQVDAGNGDSDTNDPGGGEPADYESAALAPELLDQNSAWEKR